MHQMRVLLDLTFVVTESFYLKWSVGYNYSDNKCSVQFYLFQRKFLSTALLFLINKDINSGESSCSWSLISLWWHWYCYSLWYLGGVSMFKVTIISFLENLFCRQLETSWFGRGTIYFPRQKSGLWYGRHTHFLWAPREILKGKFASKWQIFHGKIWTLNLDTRPHTFWTPKEIALIMTTLSNFSSLDFDWGVQLFFCLHIRLYFLPSLYQADVCCI